MSQQAPPSSTGTGNALSASAAAFVPAAAAAAAAGSPSSASGSAAPATNQEAAQPAPSSPGTNTFTGTSPSSLTTATGTAAASPATGLRIRASSIGTMASVGEGSAAIDHFSEYLYDQSNFEIDSTEARQICLDADMDNMENTDNMDSQYYARSDSDRRIANDIECEMAKDDEIADMDSLGIGMNDTMAVKSSAAFSSSCGTAAAASDLPSHHQATAAEYWWPDCRECGCCRGYKYGCICVTSRTAPVCKCGGNRSQIHTQAQSQTPQSNGVVGYPQTGSATETAMNPNNAAADAHTSSLAASVAIADTPGIR